MKTNKFQSIIARIVMLTLLVTQTTQVVALTLATKPLAATTTSVVRPNLMYVLDDSGSMAWDYTPDYINDVTDSTGPSNGAPDTLTAVRTGGAITAITFTATNAYTLGTPTIVIEGGGGTGASATITLNATTKKISSITMTNGGSGYTSLPFVALIGGLPNVTWGMCWGTTGSNNLGGNPKDTNVSPQCTSNYQPAYATAAINYQYYDPAIRYELPLKADGTKYAAPSSTAASSDGFLGGSSKNLTNTWVHEVWCNVSTAVPTAADPTAAGKCREVSDTSSDNLFPNISFNFRKSYNGPATYFTMSAVEYCTDDRYTNCVRSTTPQVVGSTTFNVPSYYRWCSYYNPLSHSFGGCQGRRDSSHAIPNYLGGWVSTGAAGVQATANLVIDANPTVGQKLTSVTIGGVDVVDGATFEIGQNYAYTAGTRVVTTATDVAQAVCESVRSGTPSTGYSCAQAGAMVTLQSSVIGTAGNGQAVLATGPVTVGDNSVGEIRILTATANLRLNSVTLTRSDASTVSLISSPLTATGSTANFAQALCQAINSGPNAGTYIARSGNPADPTLAYGQCLVSVDAYVGVKRIPADALDNGATFSFTAPAAGADSTGTITINATLGETRLSDVTLTNLLLFTSSVLTSKPLDYADGTLTTAIAADVASKISIAGCTATAAGNAITIAGSCVGTLGVAATGTAATGKFRVTSKGNIYPDDLGGIQVNGTQIVGHLTSSNITNGSAVSTNASTLRTQIGNSTASQNTVGGVVVGNGSGGGHGFTAAAPVANGADYDVTVTAPVGNTYNNKSFTFQAGTIAAAGLGSAPLWSFPITGATADSVNLTSIVCGGTTAVGTRNTGIVGGASTYVANLATGASTNGLNGKVGAGSGSGYSYSCTNASMTSPQYRCTVTGPAGAPACANLAITKDASISLSTTTPAAVGGTAASNNTWAVNFTDATSDNQAIERMRCGPTAGAASTSSGTQTISGDATISTTTTVGSFAQNLATDLIGSGGSNFDPDGGTHWSYSGGSSSFCTANGGAGTVACTFAKTAPACSSPLTVVVGAGLSSTTPSLSGSNWTFTISGASAASRTVTSIGCPEITSGNTTTSTGAMSAGSSGTLATRATALKAAVLANLSSTYWNTASSSCSGTGTPNVTCTLVPISGGICNNSTTAPTINSANITRSVAASGQNWVATFTSIDANDSLTSITCPSATVYRAVVGGASTGTTFSSTTQKVQRLEQLRADLNNDTANSFTWSCPTTATDASGFTCSISGPGTCTSPTLASRATNNSSGIYIGGVQQQNSYLQVGSYTAGVAATTPSWVFDITNATAASKTISAISCGGTSILPSSAPSTGTLPASSAYVRINNLTGGVEGPPATPGTLGPTNGYTLVCDAATASATQPTCNLTGPTGLASCDGTTGGGFVVTKDASISFGTVSFTNGSAASTPTEDFSTALSTVSAFGVGRAAQGASASGITSVITGPVVVSSVPMTNGTPSISGIGNNATGTPPNVLVMSGGLNADASTNNWNGVGILKRTDIVATNNSYSRSSGRTDCAGATCNYTEEMQNFANWYTYYRTRMLMMKSATTAAFSQLDGNYRVGFDNICQATGTTVKKPVAQFLDGAVAPEVPNQRTNWWTQLTSTSPSCATPLRAEAAKIGRYFAGKLTSQTDPLQYSCQQNFTLLVTDGYWNENEPANTAIPASTDIGNVDNNLTLAPRPYYDGAQTSTSCTSPAVGAARNATNDSCRTLADIAWYYYANDIRSSVKDVVVTTATAHGLTPGQSVTISGVVSTPSVADPTASFNGTVVAHVIDATHFRYAPYTDEVLVDPGTRVSGGIVTVNGVDITITSAVYSAGLYSNGTVTIPAAGAVPAFVRDVSENNVITTSDDSNQHQHVNFYAMGLGIDGTLEYRSDYQTAGVGDFSEIRAGTRNWPAPANLDPTAVDDMWHATVNGHGKYFSARNLPNVVAGLREALTKIGARVGSAAAAATSNLQPVEGDNYAYVASYATLDWTGDLQSRSIDTSTGNVSASTACNTADSGCQWSAQSKLDDLTWSSRRIFVAPTARVSGDPLRTFNFTNLTGAEQAWFSPVGLSQYATLVVSNPTEMTTEHLVNFLRGFRGYEQDGSGNPQIWRKRAHVLGDIVNTQPEFLKAPNKGYTDVGYADYKTAKAARKAVVFVSSQDGMMHAFNAEPDIPAGTGNVLVGATSVTPGQEMWAYIPKQAMSSMKVLADTNYTNNHRYFVDGPIVLGDVNFGGGASDWHTILVAGQGTGGTSYFALDVTDPTNPLFLWEVDNSTAGFANLGYTFSNPVIAKNPIDGLWNVYFTSGYNNADGQGYLYAVNPQNGVLRTATKTDQQLTLASWAGSVVTFTLPGHSYSIGSNITVTDILPAGYNGSYTVTAITANTFSATKAVDPGAYVSGGAVYDGRPRNLGKLQAAITSFKTDATAEYMYVGDLLGDLWRFDLNPGAADHTPRSVFKLAHLENSSGIEQPITTKPALTVAPNTAASRIVIVGTGKYLETSDLSNTDVQAVYAIKDALEANQVTWNPATDTILDGGGASHPAFLYRKLISDDVMGNPIQTTDEYGAVIPARNVCLGQASTVAADGTCIPSDTTVLDWDYFGGWQLPLPELGERVNVDVKIVQGTVVFASNIPGATTCTVGGSAFINFLDYSSGDSVESGGKASLRVAGALVVGITVIKLSSGEVKVIVTKSDYKQSTFKVPVASTNSFLGKRSMWREFEAY